MRNIRDFLSHNLFSIHGFDHFFLYIDKFCFLLLKICIFCFLGNNPSNLYLIYPHDLNNVHDRKLFESFGNFLLV